MELVLDASVIIKWFLEEKLSQKAIDLRHQHLKKEIFISTPTLLIFEIANALCTKTNVEENIILSAIENFYLARIKEYSFDEELVKHTVEIAKKFEITAYDATYVALAKTLSCKFLTADKKLYRKVKSLKFVGLFE